MPSSRLRRSAGAFLSLDDGAARDVHLHLVGDAQLHDVPIDGHDGAELAGNSVATAVLLRLATLLERADWRVWAERSFAWHARRLTGAPQAMPYLVSAMERASSPPRHTVIVGARDRADTLALVREFESRLRPDDDLVVVSDETRDALARLVSFAAKMPMPDGRATAYVCRDYACRLPVHEPAEMAALLEE